VLFVIILKADLEIRLDNANIYRSTYFNVRR